MQNDLPAPASRPLMVYAFDPSQGRSLGNHMTIHVPYEKLQPGPRGPYLEVIDYDASNDRYYRPVDLDAPEILLQDGLAPSESDPRFHQQMVYAVARETIHQFERALGRRIRWGYRSKKPLRIYPHAMQEANAYYDRGLGALVFGYFAASADDVGANLPNQTVFTCLSHDIVAHETTHAVLDGQRPYFMQDTNVDVPAFHEGFADIVALFMHFSNREALYETMVRTGGQLFANKIEPRLRVREEGPAFAAQLERPNPMIELARQFGEGRGQRSALRSALGHAPNSRAIAELTESHDRGAILVAAIFDAYFSSFEKKTADLFRIGRASGAVRGDDLHPDLAARLSKEAAKLAQHFATMCIRAIDYCPPVDITFGDYLRALITADYDLYPQDTHDYRGSLIEAFRLRGLYPNNVASLSEDSLRWKGVERGSEREPVCAPLDFNLMTGQTAAMDKKNAIKLHTFGRKFAPELRLTKIGDDYKLFVESFHPLVRSVDGIPRVEIVTGLIQRQDIPLDPDDPNSPKIRAYGGATVILNPDGTVRYIIHKRLGDPSRTMGFQGYWEGKRASMGSLNFVDRKPGKQALDTRLQFSAVHRGF